MNITWFSRKFTYNWFMCLLGVLCAKWFGMGDALWWTLIPALSFGLSRDTEYSHGYWFLENKESNK